MILERTPCYLCGAESSAPWAEENGFSAVKCARCGLVYVNPRPSLREIDEAKRTGEHRSGEESLDVTGRFHPRRVRYFERLLSAICADRISERPIRWLDVGSGHGELLLAARKLTAAGSELVGVEPNQTKREQAAARGVRHVASLGDAGDQFDVISLINVYSHLPDPIPFLAALRDRLKPNGSLLVQTGNGADLPDRGDYPDRLYLPDHLSFLGERHLHDLAGFLDLRLVTIRRERCDALADLVPQVAKLMLRRPSHLFVPYRSSFRSLTARFDHLQD